MSREPGPDRAAGVLALLLVAAMIGFTFGYKRTDKAWKWMAGEVKALVERVR